MQPTLPVIDNSIAQAIGAAMFLTGNVLVLTSMWALGVTGTYLGDYFGILMDEKVTSFPFNVTTHPMYRGSFLSFLGTSLWYGKPAGVVLAVEVYIMYILAELWEEPTTEKIYAEKAKSMRPKTRSQSKKKK